MTVASLAAGATPLAACPACLGDGIPAGTVRAYIVITVMLSLLPFALGGAIWWMARRRQEPDAAVEGAAG